MKHIVRLLVTAFIVQSASAQVYSGNVVGYANHMFVAGNNLFANPLEASANTLSVLFNPATVPDGTIISLWNPTTDSYDTSATLSGGIWSLDLTLNPGTGALLNAPTAFLNTFVGYVDNHDGSAYDGFALSPPPTFSGPDGLYLLSDKAPVANTGSDIFLNILGRLPNLGEQVITSAGTSTYQGAGQWDIVPVLNVSDAAYLNIGPISSSVALPALAPVPEPTTIALTLLGLALIPVCRRCH
ncbi:MAG TPA: PEP-CTERM sorting domain-containing protein [bacterium]|nr:PEP-CTERM sorting domain-containing protein [bacterium]